MGTIIAFPVEPKRLGSASVGSPDSQATILILPVIRIERHGETTDGSGPEEGTSTGRGRRRRARS